MEQAEGQEAYWRAYNMAPEENRWQSFQTPMEVDVTWERFEDFVAAPPLAGLGTSVDHLRDICRSDMKALDAIDRATQRPGSGDVTQTRV